ncbi:MAG: protein kinase [Calothrix sp. SM1_5_4]|nr:protein kinase [Calothrix sp. SM1_5_4]
MEQFGKYELLEKIGTGGMAEVYLCRPAGVALSKLMAIKRILPNLRDDGSFLRMLVREGAIALRFRHHAIITVHELSNVGELYYIAMEYFPGVTLTEIIRLLRNKKGQLYLLDKVHIIKNIAEALQYIHDFAGNGMISEIIHRDISPHNILVGFDGGLKLIDFGIAKVSSDTTQSRTIKGKIAYMSPEQVRGQALSKQTDIFSLGIVFWELLTGRKLFTGKTIKEVIAKIEKCDVPPVTNFVEDLPEELNRICMRALSPDLKTRYSSAGELVEEIDAFLKKFGRDRNHAQQLGLSLQSLFPDQFKRVQEILHKYEAYDLDPASPLSELTPAPSVANRSAEYVRDKSFFSSKKSTPSILLSVAAMAAVGVGALLYQQDRREDRAQKNEIVKETPNPRLEFVPPPPAEVPKTTQPEATQPANPPEPSEPAATVATTSTEATPKPKPKPSASAGASASASAGVKTKSKSATKADRGKPTHANKKSKDRGRGGTTHAKRLRVP